MTITQLYVTPRSVGGGPAGDSNAGPGRQPAQTREAMIVRLCQSRGGSGEGESTQ